MLLAYSWLSLALDLAQMVLEVLKNPKPTQVYMLNNLCYNNFAQKSSPGVSLLLAYSWLSMALGSAQMVLDVQKNLKPTQFYLLNNLCFNNFSKKSIPGDVRAQVLQEPVGASYAVQGQKSGKVPIRWPSWGQELSNGASYIFLHGLAAWNLPCV